MTPDLEFARKRLGGSEAVWNKLTYDRDGIIEASAGTGKTYALQSIVLKLAADKEAPVDVKNILLVTYSDKAAGELKERIRDILREAGLLRPDFDETTICTIHSFCRELLVSYAFENRMPMKIDIGGGYEGLIHRAVRTAMLGDEFKALAGSQYGALMLAAGLESTDALAEACEKQLNSCLLADSAPCASRRFDDAMRAELVAAAEGAEFDVGNLVVRRNQVERTSAALDAARSALPDLASERDEVAIRALVMCADACRVLKTTAINGHGQGVTLFDLRDDLRKFAEAVDSAMAVAGSWLKSEIVRIAWPVFLRLKDEAATLSFDDLIMQAYRITEREEAKEKAGERSEFFDAVRRRYRIALVDEFQDTDDKQWAIFRRLFSSRVNRLEDDDVPAPKKGFLLVVGDPKQSIYGFRGAKISTYLAAKEVITSGKGSQPLRSLNATYRSSEGLVMAFNKMFGKGTGWFDEMSEDGRHIRYEKVKYPDGNERFAGLRDFTGRPAVTLLESLPEKLGDPSSRREGYGNQDKCLPVFLRNAALEIRRLHDLPVAYRTFDQKRGVDVDHRLRYGDMCVLVRNAAGAAAAKRALSKVGIPFAMYKEREIFATEECEALIAFFDFVAHPGRNGTLAALLLTPLFGVPPCMLEARLKSGDRAFSELSEKWQELARRREWNILFESVMDDTSIARPLKDDFEYDRRWMATRQMLDSLLAAKGKSALTAEDFAETLRAWRKSDCDAGESGSLRQVESESDRVQIITMHSSKGLEFGAVFVAAGMSQPQPDQVNDEKRLLYVALTRAEHKLYLPWTKWSPHKRGNATEHGLGSVGSFLLGDGCLSRGIQALCDNPEVVELSDAPGAASPANAAADEPAHGTRAPLSGDTAIYHPGNLRHLTMQWDSFTSLSGRFSRHSAADASEDGSDEPRGADAPARSVRSLLPRGAQSGNVFHEIMETLCSNDDSDGAPGFAIGRLEIEKTLNDEAFAGIVRAAMARNALANSEENGDSTMRALMRMAWKALNTEIAIGGRSIRLKDIDASNRRAEVEFAVDESSVFEDDAVLFHGKPRDGVFNGKIDLLIRPDGLGAPVYIIDWKTNSLQGYDAASVAAAMEASGYGLQFKLYSLAAGKWLGEEKIAGVAYLFVRGGDAGEASGVYSRAADGNFMDECRKAVRASVSGPWSER